MEQGSWNQLWRFNQEILERRQGSGDEGSRAQEWKDLKKIFEGRGQGEGKVLV